MYVTIHSHSCLQGMFYIQRTYIPYVSVSGSQLPYLYMLLSSWFTTRCNTCGLIVDTYQIQIGIIEQCFEETAISEYTRMKTWSISNLISSVQ